MIDRLTVTEHLDLFGKIKGIPKKERDVIVNSKIWEMGLDKYR